MSGGGGSSSDGGGGDRQAAAKAAMTSQAAYSGNTNQGPAGGASAGGNYGGNQNPDQSYGGDNNNNNNDNYTQDSLKRYEASLEDYDEPDKAHFNQTQKDINTLNKEIGDVPKMSKEQYDQFNEDLNKYYGTENKKYEPYGRAGEGTVNLSFKEHWDNVGMQSPALKFSPTLRFLAAAGKNVGEYLTSDYGTYKYGGPGQDSGGLLGGFGSGGSGQVSSQDREIMNNIAPEAPYIVSGIAKPTNSPAANWYNGLGNTGTNPGGFDLATEYANAKSAVAKTLNNKGPMAMLAVNDSPYYDWLKTKNLDKGIL
mgnify:FL=1